MKSPKLDVSRYRLAGPPKPPRPARMGTGLPSTGGGSLRVRWRSYEFNVGNTAVDLAFNAWRVTVFLPPATFEWAGVPLRTILAGLGTPLQVNRLTFGGAYDEHRRPLYVNEVVRVNAPNVEDAFAILVQEEYFDGYAAPGN